MTEHEEARRLAFKRDMDALIFKAKQGRLSLGEQNDLGMMLSVWLDEHEEGAATPPGSGGSMTEHEGGRRLVAVGEHECVTCHRCACTFARVHPACPRCSQEARGLVALAKAEQERDAAIADCQTAEENARAALCRAQDAEDDLQTATQMLSEHGLAS